MAICLRSFPTSVRPTRPDRTLLIVARTEPRAGSSWSNHTLESGNLARQPAVLSIFGHW